jgi:hypothetical protein
MAPLTPPLAVLHLMAAVKHGHWRALEEIASTSLAL